MSRGKWTKNDLKRIWKNYVENKIYDIFPNDNFDDWDLSQEAPCSWCGERMVKAAYIGNQINEGDYSYDIDHIDGNPRNNDLENLQPMHPICNKNKN